MFLVTIGAIEIVKEFYRCGLYGHRDRNSFVNPRFCEALGSANPSSPIPHAQITDIASTQYGFAGQPVRVYQQQRVQASGGAQTLTTATRAGGEYGVGIYLDVINASIVVSKVDQGTPNGDPNSYSYTFPDYSNNQFKLIGNIHGHPDQKIHRTDGSPGNSQDDRDLATSRGITVYSLERANKTDNQASIYRSSSNGYGASTSLYVGGRDLRSIKHDSIWQKINLNDR